MKNLVNKLLRPLGVEVHGTGYLNMIRQKEFKRDPFDLQEQLLDKPASTIFDVGGHVGGMSLKYLKRFPSASIHTFEPFPDSFRELSQNVKDTPSIHPVEAAVSDHTDGATFFVNTKVVTPIFVAVVDLAKTITSPLGIDRAVHRG